MLYNPILDEQRPLSSYFSPKNRDIFFKTITNQFNKQQEVYIQFPNKGVHLKQKKKFNIEHQYPVYQPFPIKRKFDLSNSSIYPNFSKSYIDTSKVKTKKLSIDRNNQTFKEQSMFKSKRKISIEIKEKINKKYRRSCDFQPDTLKSFDLFKPLKTPERKLSTNLNSHLMSKILKQPQVDRIRFKRYDGALRKLIK